ncbi:MAG: RNA-binding protein [Rubrobacteridae bacterium]|nr:RNA-binding protein [Rubrobacteridae bacterium]
MKVYVGNLAYRTDETTLKKTFESFGEVDSANIIIDRDTGRSKGFAFVEMPDDEQAKAAMDALNGADLDGRAIKVSESKPRERQGGGRGFGGPRGDGKGFGNRRF